MLYFLISICIYFNCSLSLPIKDSSAEYPNENFSCTLYCSRDHIFLYKLLPCNLHRWCWKKWINNSSEYTLRFPTIVWYSVTKTAGCQAPEVLKSVSWSALQQIHVISDHSCLSSLFSAQGTSVLSPFLHIGSVITLAAMIYKKSAVQLFEKHPCLYILTFGFVSAKITNKLVVSSEVFICFVFNIHLILVR